MTRKHFEAIAHALKINEPNANNENYECEAALFKTIVIAIGGTCKGFNSHFNTDRFKRACGLDSTQNS
jgi:hypothetical protein